MLLAAGLVFGGALLSQAARDAARKAQEPEKQATTATAPAKKGGRVNFMASKTYFDETLNRSLGLPERAMILVGNVAFEHNGAVIACDSAVRYSDQRLECFSTSGRNDVIINQDSTYIYCNRAEYDGDRNLARVYSPVIKVVDGDATLYTYNFSFNTRDEVGRWFGGGVVYQNDNVMESESGFYYSDTHELVAHRGVEMKNDSHSLVSDSVRYNTESKLARFLTRTYIWTKEDEMISALRGHYNSADSAYFFHDSAYLLDEWRETWADTIDYNARVRDAVLYGTIQIDDREHSSSAFGDLGHYWGERGETRLTRRPSLLNYDSERGNADTLYIRSDTVYMYVRYPSDGRGRDSLGAAGAAPVDSLAVDGNTQGTGLAGGVDSLARRAADSLARRRTDSLAFVARADSLVRVDSIRQADPKAYNAMRKAEARRLKGIKTREAAERREAKFAAKAAARAKKEAARAEKRRLRAAENATERAARHKERLEKLAAKLAAARPSRKNLARRAEVDSLLRLSDSLSLRDSLMREDSLVRVDSLLRADSLVRLDSLARLADTLPPPAPDTTLRIFRAWNDVRIWRRGTQGVCDSLVGFSADSTLHLYTDPILWDGSSQITADSMVIHTANQKIERAEFYGNPVMGSQIGGAASRQFNQVKGRRMTSWFRDGELYRHDANDNAQALYYMQEEERLADSTVVMSEPMAFMSAKSAYVGFLFRGDSLDYIIWHRDVEYTVWPMEQIPSTQPTRMAGFVWRAERRPSLADVFDRRVRPSERAFHDSLPRPAFPIAARIDTRRKYLIDNRMWADRNDPLPFYAIERYRRGVYDAPTVTPTSSPTPAPPTAPSPLRSPSPAPFRSPSPDSLK
jgi:lipopolysaccharide export system protein LptA